MKRFDSFFQPNWGATAQTAPARAPNAAPAFIAGQRPPAVPRPAVALAALVGALALWLAAPAPGALAQPAPTASAPAPGASAPKAPAKPAGPTIKRWVDERGMVHFSDAPPPSSARATSPVTDVTPAPPLSPVDQARARDLMSQYRNYLSQQPQAPASTASAPPRAAQAPRDQSCAAQWERYGAAYSCLDGFRAGKGVVRPEGFNQCPVLKQPDCPAP